MEEHETTLVHELFGELVEWAFGRQMRFGSEGLTAYLVRMLGDFAHRDRLYAIRDGFNRPIEDVAAMLPEGSLLLAADSFEREREVHRHVGDVTLFVSGLWPEWYDRIQSGSGRDAALDYPRTGKRSYYIASTFEHGRFRDEAPVLRELSEEFDVCRFGLSLVRQQMDAMGRQLGDAA